MTTVLDAARFTVADTDEVVAASLACGCCLRLPSSVLLVEDEFAAVAMSWCLHCGASTQVSLDPEQLLRLAMQPPASVVLQTIN